MTKLIGSLLLLVTLFPSFATAENTDSDSCGEALPPGAKLLNCKDLHFIKYAVSPSLVATDRPFEAQHLFFEKDSKTFMSLVVPRQEFTLEVRPGASAFGTLCTEIERDFRINFHTYRPLLYSEPKERHLNSLEFSPYLDFTDISTMRGVYKITNAKDRQIVADWCKLIEDAKIQTQKGSFNDKDIIKVVLEFGGASPSTIELLRGDANKLKNGSPEIFQIISVRRLVVWGKIKKIYQK